MAKPVVAVLHDLVQVGRVGEGPQPARDAIRLGPIGGEDHVESGAELHAPDLDPRRANPLDRVRPRPRTRQRNGSSRSRGARARAGVRARRRRRSRARGRASARRSAAAGARRIPASRPCSRSNNPAPARYRDASSVPSSCFSRTSAFRDADDIGDDDVPGAGISRCHPWFVGHRCRRDAAIETRRQRRAQDLDQIQGVGDASVVPPVGRIDGRLDGRAVEGPVGEAIDHRDVQPLVTEEIAEFTETIAGEESAGVARGEPQPDAERRVRGKAGLQRRRVLAQRLEDRVPPVSRMDVGAVGQVRVGMGREAHG